MDPIIAPSARKRGYSDAALLHAFHHFVRYHGSDDEGLTMLVGPDQAGNLLELGIVDGELGPVIVHAMPARAKYLR